MPEAVTAASFANSRGAVGTEAAMISTKFENVILYPKAFSDASKNV